MSAHLTAEKQSTHHTCARVVVLKCCIQDHVQTFEDPLRGVADDLDELGDGINARFPGAFHENAAVRTRMVRHHRWDEHVDERERGRVKGFIM